MRKIPTLTNSGSDLMRAVTNFLRPEDKNAHYFEVYLLSIDVMLRNGLSALRTLRDLSLTESVKNSIRLKKVSSVR